MATAPVQGKLTSGFRSGVVLPVVVVTLASVILAGFGLYSATTSSDAVSVARQIRETRQALDSSVDDLAVQQEVVAVWEDPVLQLRKPEMDLEWLDTNIGVWLHELFVHDRVYILDGADNPVYGTANGARTEPETFAELRAGLLPLLDRARGRTADPSNAHERLPDREAHPSATVRTSANAVHASNLLELLERPAAASVMRIDDPTSQNRPEPGREHLLVSVRFLDGDFLQQLAKRNLIEAPRFARTPAAGKGEHAITLTAEGGQLIGYFFWRPELPGTAVMRSLAPRTALAVGLMIALMALLANSLRQSMRRQQTMLAELKASEAQAQYLALHDALTGLPNRVLFNDRLEQSLAKARPDAPVAIFLLDLDRFKDVNDTLGHLAGDRLIGEFAGRLAKLLEAGEMVARLGGDEFTILSTAANPDGVGALCGRILDAVRQPFELFGNQVFVGVSIGVAVAPDAGRDRVELMRKADIALYSAKESRGCYRVFTPTMDDGVQLRNAIAEQLRAALATGKGLSVHYQPQVAGANRRIVGLEALVRWKHPTRGFIPPDQFIPVAEQSGLVSALGEWVMREACAAVARWPNVFMAINLSPVQLRTAGFAESILAIVRESGADPRRIELEVTESVLLDNGDQTRNALKALRAAGLRIALDDFGTGYSSIAYLQRLQVDKIKIDGSFIQRLGQGAESAAIITAVVTLGHAMGLTVTAEGVETAEQSHFLASVGCNGMQGFLFSRAVAEERIEELLATDERERGAA
jgi:diguanylate cyclase (GGDEF)-like protein